MLIEFHSSDRMLGLKAISIYRAGIEAASKACVKVYAPTMELQEADSAASSVESWVAQSLDEMGVGEVKDLDLSTDLALSLRTACSVYLTQLGKLSEKQADLLVPLEDTNALTSQLTSLADRLTGQTEMAGISETTIRFNDGPEIPMREFERRVDAIKKKAGRP